MKIKCIHTGSSGNCYVLKDNDGQMLLLDAGVSIKEIKIGCDFNVSNIVGACVTHKHSDHSLSVEKLKKMGIEVMTPYVNADHSMQVVKKNFGNYSVVAFALDNVSKDVWEHTNSDGSECPIYGYKIDHSELGYSLLYITDVKLVKYKFKDIAYILLGVDYQTDLLDSESEKYYHTLTGHMSINTACDFIRANKNRHLCNVIIGHLSTDSAEDEYFLNEVKKVVSCDSQIAKKGMCTELSLIPF